MALACSLRRAAGAGAGSGRQWQPPGALPVPLPRSCLRTAGVASTTVEHPEIEVLFEDLRDDTLSRGIS